MRGDVRSKEVAALVEQLDKLHHGLLSVHVTKGSPLFSAHTAKVEVKAEGRKWQFWEICLSCPSSRISFPFLRANGNSHLIISNT